MGVIRAESVGKKFGHRWVFRGVAFDLEPGQSLAVLGHNGSGKTTLLKVLAGLVSPSEGKVSAGILGYAALDLALWPQLTGGEHIAVAARLRGGHDGRTLADFGLADAADQMVKEYSTGMRARLKLALSTMHAPDVLLLDEPSAAMDEQGRKLVASIVEDQLKRGAVVLATNDSADRRLATHEIVLA